MFTAVLSIIPKLWKQPRCPTTDECIKKMSFIYTMELFSHREELGCLQVWIKLDIIMLSEVSKPDSEG
jgi:hypothetical protein